MKSLSKVGFLPKQRPKRFPLISCIGIFSGILTPLVLFFALYTFRFHYTNLLGYVLLALALLMFLWGIRSFIIFPWYLGLKKSLIFFFAFYLLFAGAVYISLPSKKNVVVDSLVALAFPLYLGYVGVEYLNQNPREIYEDLHFSLTGKREPLDVPGVEGKDGVRPSPIVVRVSSSFSNCNSIQTRRIINARGKVVLEVVADEHEVYYLVDFYSSPNVNSQAVSFAEGTYFTYLSGPISGSEANQEFWEIEADNGVRAWCLNEIQMY